MKTFEIIFADGKSHFFEGEELVEEAFGPGVLRVRNGKTVRTFPLAQIRCYREMDRVAERPAEEIAPKATLAASDSGSDFERIPRATAVQS